MGRKEKTIHYIYKTTCNVTGRYYIGMHSTDNLNDGYMGSGKRLWFSINYHGKENHHKEILEYCNSREELKKREAEMVTEELITEDLCMNLMTGGQGGFSNEEHMIKAVTAGGAVHANKMENDKEYRDKSLKILTEGRDILFKTGAYKKKGKGLGRIHSDETKKLMSESSKGSGSGEKNSQFGTCWITRNGSNKKIKKEDLEEYIKDGWERGRKMNN